MHVRLPPEPRDLTLGIVAMRLLRFRQSRLSIYFAAQTLHRLLVSERGERARMVAILCEKFFCFGDESLVKHFCRPLVDARVESLALRIESETKNAKAEQRFASLLPKFGHIPARGLARSPVRGQTHLDRPDHLGSVVGVNALGGGSVEPTQNAMQMARAVLLRSSA